MGRKQMITQILIRAYTIRTVLLFVAEAAWFILAENSFSGLFELMRATLILSLLSFAVSFLVSQEDRRISPSHAVLYAVFDVLIFSIGAGVFALMEMMGIQGGSGLAVVVIPILAGMVILPFSIVLAVIARLTPCAIQFMDAWVKSFEERYPIPRHRKKETMKQTSALRFFSLLARKASEASIAPRPITMMPTSAIVGISAKVFPFREVTPMVRPIPASRNPIA